MKDKEAQLKDRYVKRAHEMNLKQKERQEWNQLFDYNTNKQLNNDLNWKKRFENINSDLDQKNQNLLRHLERRGENTNSSLKNYAEPQKAKIINGGYGQAPDG